MYVLVVDGTLRYNLLLVGLLIYFKPLQYLFHEWHFHTSELYNSIGVEYL